MDNSRKSRRHGSPLDRLGLGDKKAGVPRKRDMAYRDFADSSGSAQSPRQQSRRRKRGGGSGGKVTPVLGSSPFPGPFERTPLELSGADRARQIMQNIRLAITQGSAGHLHQMPEDDALMDHPYAKWEPPRSRPWPLRPFAGAANQIKFYAGVRRPEDWAAFPDPDPDAEYELGGLAVPVQVHLRVWMLLMAGVTQGKRVYWDQAIVLMRELLRRRPTVGSRMLCEQAMEFMGATKTEMDERTATRRQRELRDESTVARQAQREGLREAVGHAPGPAEMSSEELSGHLTRAGYPEASARTVRRIRQELGIS
jgi:hypothetical protein